MGIHINHKKINTPQNSFLKRYQLTEDDLFIPSSEFIKINNSIHVAPDTTLNAFYVSICITLLTTILRCGLFLSQLYTW